MEGTRWLDQIISRLLREGAPTYEITTFMLDYYYHHTGKRMSRYAMRSRVKRVRRMMIFMEKEEQWLTEEAKLAREREVKADTEKAKKNADTAREK